MFLIRTILLLCWKWLHFNSCNILHTQVWSRAVLLYFSIYALLSVISLQSLLLLFVFLWLMMVKLLNNVRRMTKILKEFKAFNQYLMRNCFKSFMTSTQFSMFSRFFSGVFCFVKTLFSFLPRTLPYFSPFFH